MGVERQHDLLSSLRADEVDQGELAAVLTDHFGCARAVSSGQVIYPRDRSTYALKLVHDGDKLVKILAGPGLSPADLEAVQARITSELLGGPAQVVGRMVLFSNQPVTGYWRFRDTFQILPVPANGPLPGFALAKHPFILEFSYRHSINAAIRGYRRAAESSRLALILNSLLEASVRCPLPAMRYHWVLVATKEPGVSDTAYCQEWYQIPGFEFETDCFSPADGIPPIRAVSPEVYYGQLRSRIGRSLEIPSNLDHSLARFYGLERDDQMRYFRAAFWFSHSQEVSSLAESASYLALISAVEALIPGEEASERCPACGQIRGAGPTRRFRDFLERLAPGKGKLAEMRSTLYRMRSKLSHGGHLLAADLHSGPWVVHPGRSEEVVEAHLTANIVRIALVNWLNEEQIQLPAIRRAEPFAFTRQVGG